MSNHLGTSILCLSAFGSALYLGSHLLGGNQLSTISEKDEKPSRLPLKKQIELKHVIEICLSDIKSLYNALDGGANSVELCVNRLEGGVTPSLGLIEESVTVLRATNVAVHVLIRPRPGDFMYCPSECEVIQRDIISAKGAGADGIVFGALTVDGKIDKELLGVVRLLTEGMCLTFHRAFDVCSDDLETTLEDVIAAGCDRLLTSGRACGVTEGSETLRRLVSLARGRITIVAGCGVSAQNVTEAIKHTGVNGIHAGSAVSGLVGAAPSAQTSSSSSSSSSSTEGFFGEEMSRWQCVDAAKVRVLVNNAAAGWSSLSSSPSVGLQNLTLSPLVSPLGDDPLSPDGHHVLVGETFSRSSSDSDAPSPNSRAGGGYIHVSGSTAGGGGDL